MTFIYLKPPFSIKESKNLAVFFVKYLRKRDTFKKFAPFQKRSFWTNFNTIHNITYCLNIWLDQKAVKDIAAMVLNLVQTEQYFKKKKTPPTANN